MNSIASLDEVLEQAKRQGAAVDRNAAAFTLGCACGCCGRIHSRHRCPFRCSRVTRSMMTRASLNHHRPRTADAARVALNQFKKCEIKLKCRYLTGKAFARALQVGRGQTICVTGASGFIASHCVQQLLATGYTVHGTVRSLRNPAKVTHLTALPGAAERLKLFEVRSWWWWKEWVLQGGTASRRTTHLRTIGVFVALARNSLLAL